MPFQLSEDNPLPVAKIPKFMDQYVGCFIEEPKLCHYTIRHHRGKPRDTTNPGRLRI
jgi:hypothetical protein